MGPAATTTTDPPVPRRPDYRLAALRVKDACGAGCGGRAPARSLTRMGPAHPDRQQPGNRGTPGPRGNARRPVRNAGYRPGTRTKTANPPLDTAPLFRDDLTLARGLALDKERGPSIGCVVCRIVVRSAAGMLAGLAMVAEVVEGVEFAELA